MSKKKKKQQHQSKSKKETEKVLKLDDVKDMTVGQVARKQQELKDGVEENDGILDRYIKQHREDIEAKKFETLVGAKAVTDAVLEENAKEAAPDVPSSAENEVVAQKEDLGIHKVAKTEVAQEPKEVASSVVSSQAVEETDLEHTQPSKKKGLIWLGFLLSLAAIVALVFAWINGQNQNKSTSSTSETTTETTTSSKIDEDVAAFEKLYATFFTDSSQTKLQNSAFDQLGKLKAALEKIGTSNPKYQAAKAKYDALEKAIKAIKDINGKFDKPAIVDGELDTTANVKPEMTFDSVSTGLSAVDTLLASAAKMGKTQKPTTTEAPSQGGQTGNQAVGTGSAAATQVPDSAVEVSAPVEASSDVAVSTSSNPGWVNIGGVIYGMEIPAGLTLQRELSRVPYNQAAIDDVNNEAWVFNPGILENIINISRQRGYITGNEYYLEKVNIINGRGYYNLFKPDGTYLFSINCKTGYFVGNGSGYADALDF